MNLPDMMRRDSRAKAILNELRRLRLESTESSFERAVDEEAEALLSCPPVSRRTQSRVRVAYEDALDSVCSLVERYLELGMSYQLTASDVLCYRSCRAVAWGIARRILEERVIMADRAKEQA